MNRLGVTGIEQILNETGKNTCEPGNGSPEEKISRGALTSRIVRSARWHKQAIAGHVAFYYLILIIPLVIIDGKLTALGLKAGYYSGELNPLINYLFGHFEVDVVFWLRAVFVILAVMFLAYAYSRYPRYLKKYYFLLAITIAAYLAVNIAHVWFLVIVSI